VYGVSRLTPADIGARVTVRRRVADHALSDVVGDLESWDADVLAIRRRGGDLVLVAAADVVTAKVVGPSLRAAIELEGVSARGWPAPDNEWLGRWWLRAAEGFTARANSVRPLGPPGCDLDAALSFATSWYRMRELVPQLQVVVGSSLDRDLARRGWLAAPEVSVLTTTIERATSRLEALGAASTDVEVCGVASSAWLELFRGGGSPAAAVSILNGCDPVAFALIPGDSAVSAIGRATVEKPWVGLTAVEVVPDARQGGHARAVVAALLAWARAQGATRAYLEVLATNAPASTLYESLGFTEHHRYTCRRSALTQP
jgi:N-acetylglutamate synthase